MQITIDQLKQIMNHAPTTKLAQYLPFLNAATEQAEINTPARVAAFLAQLAHESAEFRYMEEIASGAAYEGRHDLGNTQPGDGKRFKGRGPIQLTGRANYQRAGEALGLDLVGQPEQVATPQVGFQTSAWFWRTHNLNELADAGDFKTITKRINGGLNGYDSRLHYWGVAKAALGV